MEGRCRPWPSPGPAADHGFLTRLDMTRRMMGTIGTQAYQEEGLAGIGKMLAIFTGGGEDRQVAWKYKSLGMLPEGTLGRAFWEHCTSNRFPFPGEKGGIPEFNSIWGSRSRR